MKGSSMSGLDAIDGASVPGWHHVYVIGSSDERITFFSQQVRGYNLVSALVASDVLRNKKRFGVIGAGAAGLSAAAALSILVPTSSVDVFEREERTLHLQRDSTKRNLHPHVYDWPLRGALDEFASLPFLDWRSGTSSAVATEVGKNFDAFVAWRGGAITLRLLTEVTGIVPVAGDWQIKYKSSKDNKEGSGYYDAVFLAIGFGRERHLQEMHSHSYWTDQGVPGPLKYAKDRALVLVSGAGDGGLIDLCAASMSGFDHEGLIKRITEWPAIRDIFEELIAIDTEAARFGKGFDFVNAYTQRIGSKLRQSGLVEELSKQLRHRVKVVFNTEEPPLLQQPTSTLNRLAVFLLFAAAEEAGIPITHMAGKLVSVPGAPGDYQIAGTTLHPDEIFVRHGSDREESFLPFNDIHSTYKASHELWLKAEPQRRNPPQLEDAARQAIKNGLAELGYLVDRRHHDAAAEHQPRKVRIAHHTAPTQVVLAGIPQITDLLDWWGESDRELRLDLAAAPSELKNLACATARFAIHAQQIRLHSGNLQWAEWLEELTEESPHVRALHKPRIDPALAGQMDAVSIDADVDADRLHKGMDLLMLKWINEHLIEFLGVGYRKGNWVVCEIDRNLRHDMANRWAIWEAQLRADPKLLSRLLRLASCTIEDDVGEVSDRQVLVGPHKVANIVRSIILALAAAEVWPTSAPCIDSPGNFDTRDGTGKLVATIHASGAELIKRRSLEDMVSRHRWRTSFVLLSELAASAEFERESQLSLIETASEQPRLDASPVQPSVVIGAGERLRTALRLGRQAIAEHLSLAQAQKQRVWAAQIEKAED
jgi:hypothetical protein